VESRTAASASRSNFYPDTWDLFDLAAGISRIELQCHRETWRSLVDGVKKSKKSDGEEKSILPGEDDDSVKAEDDMITVQLSGIDLMSILRITASDRIVESFDPGEPAALAIAFRLRKEIVKILGRIAPQDEVHQGQGEKLPAIVLDDKIAR
jgi:hypothetical protein